MLKVVHDNPDPSASNAEAGGSLLDEIVREGARQMLAAALQAEVAAYLQAHADQLNEDGRRGGGGARPARQRQAHRREHRATQALLLIDPAGLGP